MTLQLTFLDSRCVSIQSTADRISVTFNDPRLIADIFGNLVEPSTSIESRIRR